MEALNEKIDNCKAKLKEFQGSNDIIQGIGEIVDKLYLQDIEKWTGDELSRAALKLSLLLAALSPVIQDAKMIYNMTYVHRKFKTASHYLSIEAGTNRDKDMISQKYVNDIYTNEVYENYKAETLKLLYQDIERIVSIIQSRIKILISERINSNQQI